MLLSKYAPTRHHVTEITARQRRTAVKPVADAAVLTRGIILQKDSMDFVFVRAGRFWIATIISLAVVGLFFSWLLGLLSSIGFYGPPRIQPTNLELISSTLIALLFSASIGLIVWRKKYGSCPMGTGKTTGAAGTLGTAALFCPICTVLPVGIAGFSLSLSFLTPYLPLIRIIVLLMLVMNLSVLLPRKSKG